MNKFRFTIKVLAVAIFMFAFASLTQAQATRTWVSGVGDDANPCSRTAPCKTFAGAISKTATNGEIDALDPGGFGALTITKSITVDGSMTGVGGILNALTTGVLINGSNVVVTLRGLSIQGAGTGQRGIRVLLALNVFIENCFIMGQNGAPGNGIEDTSTTAGLLEIYNTTITNCSGSGISVDPSSGTNERRVHIINSRSSGNNVHGVLLGSNVKATIYNSSFNGNTQTGVFVKNTAGGSTVANVDHCVVSDNVTGFNSSTSNSTIRVSNTTALNTTNLFLLGGGGAVSSYGNNQTGGVAFTSVPTAQK
jgi:hypothetical protein